MKIEHLNKLFNKPCVIGLIGNVNSGKSNTIYWLVDELRKTHSFNLYTYGLRNTIKGATQIFSVAELEQIKGSFVVLDEFFGLLDLENRKVKRQIENTLRLINHNNNVLLLVGLPENFKKFISAKLDYLLFKQCSINDCINGSFVKKVITSYKGVECGTEVLNIPVSEALLFDGVHYSHLNIGYVASMDSKAKNKPVFEKCSKKCS